MTESKKLKIAVIGAGASGIMTVLKLRDIGQTDVHVFEQASDIGGTWRDNRYPGVACDIPSHLYRFSFAPNAQWSRTFAPGNEIQEYIRKVYISNSVDRHVSLNTEVTDARYRDGTWTLVTTSGAFGPFNVVITAMGILRRPIYPEIEGLANFAGVAVHSGRWVDGIDLRGKRVGIIGVGSTGTQIATAIAADVSQLTMFQRTAQWIIPMSNLVFSDEERQEFGDNPDLMQELYDRLAREINNKFAAAMVGEDPRTYDRMVSLCEEYLSKVQDPELRKKLRPDYKVGCKRLVMSDGFYEAIQRPNAELVADKIVRIEPRGVRTADQRLHELDVLILATGYDAHSPFDPMQVTGRDGRTVAEAWKESAEAYLGVTIPGFPNFFMIGGPNSPIGNFSFLMTAENQCKYALSLVQYLADSGAKAVEPKHETMRAFYESVKERMPRTIWLSGCKNWYMDKNGSVALWPWTWAHFESKMRQADLDDFNILDDRPVRT